MKVVKLYPNPRNACPPEEESPPKDLLDASSKTKDDKDWSYQGKSRKQVEGSYRIFVYCLIAALFITLMALIANA